MTDRSTSHGTARDRLERAVETSLLVRTTRRFEATLSRWFRGSRMVQWFLAEPDPEVIVIDLRETYTVGPFLGIVDRVVETGSRLGERTGATKAVSRTGGRVESKPLRVFGFLLLALAVGGLVASLASAGAPGGWLVLLGFALLATRERRSASELAQTRVGRTLRAAFEPPEPPEQDA